MMTPTAARRPVRRPRSGAMGPALSIVLALLFLLGLLTVAQLRMSSQSVHVATWDAGGAVAEEVAVSAIEEAAWRLNGLFSDPRRGDGFNDLRLAILGHKVGALDLTRRVYPSSLKELLARSTDRPLYRTVRLDSFRAVLGIPQDGKGDQVVDFDAAATLTVAGHTIYRRVVERRRYGIMFASPLKPWDRVTLAILDHTGVPVLTRKVRTLDTALHDANRLIGDVNFIVPVPGSCDPDPYRWLPPHVFLTAFVRIGTAPDLPSDLRSKVEQLQRARPELEKMLASLDPETRSWTLWQLAGMPTGKPIPIPRARCYTQPQLPQLPSIGQQLVFQQLPPPLKPVTSTASPVQLKPFDYEARLRDEYSTEEDRLKGIFEPLNRRLLEWMQNPPTSEGARAGLASTLHAALQQMPDRFKAAATRLNAITRHAEAHTRLEIPPEILLQKGPHLLPVAYHLSNQADFDAFRATYRSFSGHLAYVGRTDLTAALPGFSGLMILSQQYAQPGEEERSLILKGITVQDPGRDLVIVHAERLDLDSSGVEAGVHVHDRLILGGGRASIRGQLVMERLRPLAERGRNEELDGTVEYNPALASGAFPQLDEKQNLPPVRLPASSPSDKIATSGLALDHWPLALLPRGRDRALFLSPGAFDAAAQGGGPR